jgi:DNA-directed RNA polymerase subunit RPC12/RpoP
MYNRIRVNVTETENSLPTKRNRDMFVYYFGDVEMLSEFQQWIIITLYFGEKNIWNYYEIRCEYPKVINYRQIDEQLKVLSRIIVVDDAPRPEKKQIRFNLRGINAAYQFAKAFGLIGAQSGEDVRVDEKQVVIKRCGKKITITEEDLPEPSKLTCPRCGGKVIWDERGSEGLCSRCGYAAHDEYGILRKNGIVR